ncbi:TerC family protein [Accumulibacter sp.]|uniref:TerC family protein n=1 Tax=Accumulibacter sp. TaxID=2053492 RepID=UPI0025D434C9|nr:TerC family protein [Accumulibacter sp.]MCM8594293.1 TerC family protein [Accumulibacter sp.]MCM8627884.1 TerC family protein [Accumulibacter sp.]MDS4048437.1 TerC family protein [Accumulibacter sp.]
MTPDLASPVFWISVLQIITIDILLGGDNAVVIALACRKLPDTQRNQAITWGVFGAIALRVVLIYFALQLLAIPYLKIVGGLLLVWIGVKLVLPEHEDAHGSLQQSSTLLGAIRTIIIADAVMSLDNVIAVAAAAHGSIVVVVFGIVVSIPIVVWGSKLVLALMDRFPVVITAGGALLGWIGGGMLVTDPGFPQDWRNLIPHTTLLVSAAGALLVVLIGKWLASRQRAPHPAIELSAPAPEPASEGEVK